MPTESHTESVALRTALRELVALSTIPAVWVGREPPIIAAGLADVLVGSLHLDFAFVRLCDPKGGAAIEVTRGDAWKAFSERLRTHLGGVDRFSCKEIVADLGGAEPCCGIVIPIGVNAEAGLVAAACTRTDFPSEIDQLLLSVAANHAAAAFQNAHLRHELDAKVAELREARDELEMKVAERTADLQRSEANLAEAQRLSHCGSFAWNVFREGIYWSEETYRIFECDQANEPTMESILQRTHPEDRALVRQVSNRAQQEREHFHFEHRLLMPNGSIKHIEVVAHAVARHASDKFGVVGAVLDVTERKRAEALRDGESRILEMIARDAPLEEILENLVRVVEAQFAGLLCSVLLLDEDGQHVRHGAAPSLPKAYTKAIDGLCIGPKAGSCGTAMYRRETVIVTDILQDPLWEPYRALAEPLGFRACWSTPILAHSGKALGSFAMYYREPRGPSSAETRALEMATHLAGIATERKLAREERERLRQAQADLAHINRVTTMGELTASLAHEIRQPISAAVTNAKTCLRWLGRDKPDVVEAAEAASRLVKDVTRAADIIGRISSLFKKDALQRELVDVNELIREMIVLLRSEANRYSISIRTELAEDVPKVMADRVQLQQVFMNLMLNGIDAMKETNGGSELAIKSEADDGQLLISVSDTGVGLPPEQADRIFRAFFTTKENGTGMGLPISRSIIESHGGRLWFTGNSGPGATFQFTLPTTVAAHA
jgi:signal transduction histidine kinase/PAS domain-containing protein